MDQLVPWSVDLERFYGLQLSVCMWVMSTEPWLEPDLFYKNGDRGSTNKLWDTSQPVHNSVCECVWGVSKERGSLGMGVGKFPSHIMVIS